MTYDHNLSNIDAKNSISDKITLTAQAVLDHGVDNTLILNIDSNDTLYLTGWTQMVGDNTATLNVHITAVI